MSLNFIFTVDRNVSIFSVKAHTALSIFSDSSCLAVSKASFKIARSSSELLFSIAAIFADNFLSKLLIDQLRLFLKVYFSS